MGNPPQNAGRSSEDTMDRARCALLSRDHYSSSSIHVFFVLSNDSIRRPRELHTHAQICCANGGQLDAFPQ